MDNVESIPNTLTRPQKKQPKPSPFTRLDNLACRALDICASLVGLVFFSPLFLIIAILIKRDSPGPVFYRGRRAGMNGRDFLILKFRTMYESPESYRGSRVTAQGDPRITRLGRWLRDNKLNELPQLWNVLKGEMSLVGPRPEDPEIAAGWPEEVRREVLSVRPGVTSPASVLYRHEETLLKSQDVMAEYLIDILPPKLRFDQLYVRNRTLLTDLDVLFWTALVMLPRLSGFSVPEHLLFWGPFSNFFTRFLAWFVIDVLVSFCSVALAGVIWRIGAPLDLGLRLAGGIALSIALLFSLINALVGLDRTSWSRASTADGLGLAVSTGLVASALFLLNLFWPGGPLLPPGMIVVAGVFSYFGFITVRYRSRLIKKLASGWINIRGVGMRSLGERVLIVGSGNVGHFTTWLLKRGDLAQAFYIVGMVDDDPRKMGMRVDGCKVIGTTKDIPALVDKYDIGLILYSIYAIQPLEQQRILSICQKTPARTIQMPAILDMLRSHFPSNELEKEQLLDKVLRNATRDGLTGAYNQGHFIKLTGRELGRARRYRHPLSLVMLSVGCNGSNGAVDKPDLHTQVLKTVAERCREIIRDVDILGRYDDGILVLALPETDTECANMVVERLLECVTGSPIQTEYLSLNAAVRVGIATTYGEITDAAALIASAQAAMEAAQSGQDPQPNNDRPQPTTHPDIESRKSGQRLRLSASQEILSE